MVLALLLQGVGGAWAATRMSAGEVAFAAELQELPPCHRQQAQEERRAASENGMACCGTAACHCAMACAALPALLAEAAAVRFERDLTFAAPSTVGALASVFYGPPLRPPAPLQS